MATSLESTGMGVGDSKPASPFNPKKEKSRRGCHRSRPSLPSSQRNKNGQEGVANLTKGAWVWVSPPRSLRKKKEKGKKKGTNLERIGIGMGMGMGAGDGKRAPPCKQNVRNRAGWPPTWSARASASAWA